MIKQNKEISKENEKNLKKMKEQNQLNKEQLEENLCKNIDENSKDLMTEKNQK